MSGMEALERVKLRRPDVPVLMLTAESDARVGVQAMKTGAEDYLVKPVDPELLEHSVRAAVRRHGLALELRELRAAARGASAGGGMVGHAPAFQRMLSRLGLVLHNDVTVFLTGESGTGKELVASAVHAQGPRAGKPFVAVNCGAVARELQESHFFGHEKGAFTGAVRRHRGLFEQAEGGTLFLDEVSELAPEAQVKLLRALQEREIRRVGGETDIPVDVRVISATNRDLRSMVDAGGFREDLFYRLVVFPVTVPPLRERREDVPLLAGHFLRELSERLGVSAPDIDDDALTCLMAHTWPGNVRELQNTMQVAVLSSQGGEIRPEHLPETMPRNAASPHRLPAGEVIHLVDPVSGAIKPFRQLEMEILLRVRELTGGNVGATAEALGVGRATVYRRFREQSRAA
jgi:two-component system response regulator HydG